jgi:WhiB family redox-sensing transcriptional regulator
VKNWRDQAACRAVAPKVFHPEKGFGRGTYVRARLVCAGCPVLKQCRAFILSCEEPDCRYGFWAGTTPDERARLMGGRVA